MHSLPERASVVIIGGGFAGASTAYALTQAGISDVLVLERESTCGYHASGRNAALCRQVTEHDVFTELATRGAQFLRCPPAGFSETPLLARTGSVLLCDSIEQADRLADRAARFDVPHTRVAASDVTRDWPLLAGAPSAGGVMFPTDGVIDVHALLQSFLAGARLGGARIVVDCEALELERRGSGDVVVVSARGRVHTRCVVIAAGAWADSVAGRFGAEPRSLIPIQRHLHVTEPVALERRDVPFVWHIGQAEFYARPEGDGLLLSACDEAIVAPCDARPAPGAIDALAARLMESAPRFVDLGIARSWACLRTFGPQRVPIIGWDPAHPWLFWVAGLGGHGATASEAVGASAATKIATRVSERLA